MAKNYKLLLTNFEQIVCGLLLTFIMVMLISQVIARYMFGVSFAWSEEITRFAFLAMVYLAASIGAQKGIHIRVTAHTGFLPLKARMTLLAFTDLLWVMFNLVVVYQGYDLVLSMESKPLISPALSWDMRYVFAVIPLAFFLQTLRIFEYWFKLYRRGWKEAEADVDASSHTA